MIDIDVNELKQKWCGWTFDEVEFKIDPETMVEFAESCGETEPRYVDPKDPDFQAVPTFTTRFHGRRAVPDDFPVKPHNSFDAGKGVEVGVPLRPGDTLKGTSEIHDIYTKTGRSGGMLFIVHRMRFRNQDDELVSIVDWRMVQRQQSEQVRQAQDESASRAGRTIRGKK